MIIKYRMQKSNGFIFFDFPKYYYFLLFCFKFSYIIRFIEVLFELINIGADLNKIKKILR